jgi:hypothetical protein
VFYVNSGTIDTAGKLTWAQLTALSQAGCEIASHTYPFGDFDCTVETQVVQYCGDNSGRGVAGVDDKRVFAETIPPADPYATRTPADTKQGTSLSTIEGLRHCRRAARRRLGAADLPPHLQRMRRVLDHDREHAGPAGLARYPGQRRIGRGRDHRPGDRRSIVTPFCC